MPLVRLSTEAGARKLLQRLVDAGRCTVDDLDTPPPGHINPSTYRNLLRDPVVGEVVQPSDPRDFTPAHGITPAEAPLLPIAEPPSLATKEEWDF